MRNALALCLSVAVSLASRLAAQTSPLDFLNRNRPVADAHNCYPEDGRWNDRIERALGAGFPIAIEQDLAWYVPAGGGPSGPAGGVPHGPAAGAPGPGGRAPEPGRGVSSGVPSGPGRVVVSHSAKTTGAEPTLRAYFFERVRPIVEAALVKN
ncbi:MAG: hypothetical protein ACLQU1_28715 [Bryobacteraceae bacterium]